MELGHYFFGNTANVENVEIDDRYGYQIILARLFDAAELSSYGHARYPGGNHQDMGDPTATLRTRVFAIRPYSWSECACSHALAVEKLDADPSYEHADDCYQTELSRARQAIPIDSDEIDAVYERLTTQFGLPMAGCAIHCTCGASERYSSAYSKLSHDADCFADKPNFEIFPSPDVPEGFRLSWYKYPLRDASMSRKIDRAEFSRLIDLCIASLPEDFETGAPVPTHEIKINAIKTVRTRKGGEIRFVGHTLFYGCILVIICITIIYRQMQYVVFNYDENTRKHRLFVSSRRENYQGL